MRRLAFILPLSAVLAFVSLAIAQTPATNLLILGKTSNASSAYSGPGDVVSGAIAWWGFRGYSAAYSGKALNICTPSDAACEDEFIVGGNLSLGTTGQTCNNSTTICTVKTMYDQSGALACTGGVACDVTQATIASRPTFSLSALGSFPCGLSTGSTQLQSANALAHAQPVTLSVVAKTTGGTTVQVLGPNISIGFGGSNTAQISAGLVVSASAANNVFHALQGVINTTSSSITVDGTTTTGSAGSNNVSGSPTFEPLFTGPACEGGIWPSAFNATQLSNMNSNQHSYWGF